MPILPPASAQSRAPLRQRGMATILIIVLAGLAITATSLGMMYAVRSAQEQQISNHALVPAESKAWSGVEIMRLYLEAVPADQLPGLTAGKTLSTSAAGISFVVAETYDSANTRVAINVTGSSGSGSRSAATTTIQAVYTITPAKGQTTTPTAPGAPITLDQSITLSGDVKILGGSNANFVVDGDVNLSGSVTGISTIQSTGDIVLSGGIKVPEVFANGSLTMSGSSSVTLKGSAIKWINSSSGGATHGVLRTNGYITTSTSGTDMYAKSDITLNGGGSAYKNIRSGANVTCPGTWWGSFDSIQSAKTTNCQSSSKIVLSVPTSELTTLTPITVTRNKIDANDYKDAANYTFEAVGGKRKVTVKNVNGLSNGVYYLGNFPYANGRGYQDFLCQEVDSSNNCTIPATPVAGTRTICQGNSTSNACVSYAPNTNTWSVAGKNLAPGVLWFQGNVDMGSGEYYNSTFASGNISTSGSHRLYALNYAGYATVCTNAFKKNTASDFAGLYPTNFCDVSAGKMKSSSTGNIAYLAGIYTGSVFSGGTINIGASSEVFGSVVAGNQLLTGGSTTIHGYVSSAGQGTATSSSWGDSTTIDLTGLPDTFDPGNTSPPATDACSSNCGQSAKVTWTRPI